MNDAIRLMRCVDGTYCQHVGPTDETDFYALPLPQHEARERVVAAVGDFLHAYDGSDGDYDTRPDALERFQRWMQTEGALRSAYAAYLAALDNTPPDRKER